MIPSPESATGTEPRRPQRLSLVSLTSSSSLDTYATTSTNATVFGIGTVAGRAIEAFGEATLRGIENVVIRRKLAKFRALFPHTDSTTIKNIDFVYDDVLELSRYLTIVYLCYRESETGFTST
jgi:hypothetical protein